MNAAAPDRTVPLALAAFAASALAAWLLGHDLSPLPFGPDPVGVPDFFSPGQVEAAEAFRARGRVIALSSTVVGLAALTFLALYRGRPVGSILSAFGSRPVLGGAILGGLIALVLAVVGLPFAVAGWDAGREFGIITSGPGRFAADQAISSGISIAIFVLAGALAVFAWDRFGRWFWAVASVAVGVFAIVWLWLWPVAVAPLFNDFDPLPRGEARTRLEALADRAGIAIEGVYTVDASRRTNAINAWVNGLGPSRRVVIQDTATDRLDRPQMSTLVAHELAHVEARDPERGLLFVLLSVPLAALAIQSGTARIIRRRDEAEGGAVVVLPLALGVGLAVFALSIPGAWLSRQIELAADGRALELTGDGAAMVSLQERLVRENLAEPSRPEPFRTLFATHPDPIDRIGLAVAFDRRIPRAPDPEGSR